MNFSKFLQLCGVLMTLQTWPSVAAPADGGARGRPGLVAQALCHLPGIEDRVRCVRLAVPLDHRLPAGRTIEIFAAVLPALSRDSATDAFVMLPGGPGQSGDALMPLATGPLKAIREKRDIVLVYPRGTARSQPIDCPALASDAALPRAALLSAAASCAAKAKHDPALFTSEQIVADLEALRAALGYPQMSLWGGSFGSRLAQHYARVYPARTRLVVLDGVAPAGVSLLETTPVAAQAALEGISAACTADARCKSGDDQTITRSVALLRTALERKPAQATLRNPVTGKPALVTLDGATFAGALHLALYDPNTRAMVPQLVRSARAGDYAPLLAFASLAGAGLADGVSIGANFSAICAEDVPITRADVQARAAAASFLGGSGSDSLPALCPVWPHRALPAAYLKGFASSVPALLLSGQLDPVTPPSGGAIAARYFTGSVHVVVPASAHITSGFGCVPRQIVAFVDTGKTTAASFACALTPTPPAPLATPNG